MFDISEWQHVFKVDPNKSIEDDALEALCESGTDAIIVGGSDGVTLDNTLDLLARVRRYALPCVLEVSNIESLSPGFDYYFIPSVLNSTEDKWVKGLHHEAVKAYGPIMNWNEIMMEGYCVLNADAKVAKKTGANTALSSEDIVAYARMTEKMYHFPIFYLEYSGTYGDPSVVRDVQEVLDKAQLFYGGGIETVEQAKEMAELADTVVIGNVIYDDLEAALRTVEAVKGN